MNGELKAYITNRTFSLAW